VFIKQMAQEGRLHENPDPLRVMFDEFWSNPLADHWGYQCDASEHMLTDAAIEDFGTLTLDSLERTFAKIRGRLGASQEFLVHQRQVAQAAKDAAERPVLIEQLLKHYESNLRAEIRRTGDVQKNVAAYLDRETARLNKLTIQRLRTEAHVLNVDDTAIIVENARLMGLGANELRDEVRKQNARQSYAPPAQAYGSNGFKPLPPTYDGGKPWTTKLLYNLAPCELDRIMKLYGGPNLDKACAANRAKGIR
jgi:hypothetical protein